MQIFQEQKPVQQQRPQMYAAVEILQLDVCQLQSYINTALLENPTLECGAAPGVSLLDDLSAGGHAAAGEDAEHMQPDFADRDAVAYGEDLTTHLQFQAERLSLEPELQRKGWWGPRDTTDPVTGEPVTIQQGSPWRLDTIFRTNMSVLYSAGRWAEQMENVDDRPYWMYTGINDSHTRKSHLALHGLVLRYDDPFWQAFYPPNGCRCRCGVIALSAADVRARGLKVSGSGSAMGWELKLVSEKTGEMQNVATFNTGTTKVATDVGWSYAPGAAYRPDLARYQGTLQPLAQQELRG